MKEFWLKLSIFFFNNLQFNYLPGSWKEHFQKACCDCSVGSPVMIIRKTLVSIKSLWKPEASEVEEKSAKKSHKARIIVKTWCLRGGCCWPCWPQERGGGVMLRGKNCLLCWRDILLEPVRWYIFLFLVRRHCFVWKYFEKDLIGGGAAGGAPAPQLGLPHLVRYQAYSIVTVTMY